VYPVVLVWVEPPKMGTSLEAAPVALRRVVQHLAIEQVRDEVVVLVVDEDEDEATVVAVVDAEGVDGEEDVADGAEVVEEEVVALVKSQSEEEEEAALLLPRRPRG
jgi:DNA-directed RNA polymerase specialized sigma24 family protein